MGGRGMRSAKTGLGPAAEVFLDAFRAAVALTVVVFPVCADGFAGNAGVGKAV